MRIRLGLLTLRSSLIEVLIVFVLLGTLVLVSMTQWTEARIAKRNGLYSIYVMNTDDSGVVAVVEDLGLVITPAWSPKPLAVSAKGKSSTLRGTLKSKQ